MRLIIVVALLFLPSEAGYANSPRPHISDSLGVKCDALPYRTAYIGNRCYFAVSQEAKLSEATAQCSAIFPGAKIATDLPTKIFNEMALEKSKFHVGTDSSGRKSQASGAKQFICSIDSGYKCGENSEPSAILPGKCIASDETKKNFAQAAMYCARFNMEVPTIDNELENRMIREAMGKGYAWIRNKLHATWKWNREKYYSKYDNCNRPNIMLAGGEVKHVCGHEAASVLEKKSGYWGIHPQHAAFGSVCVAGAQNEFTPGRKICTVAHHEYDEETGLCEWTGPKDACLQVVDFTNKTLFCDIKDFPKQTHSETNFAGGPYGFLNDVIIKVIVRRGCMFTGYAAGLAHAGLQDVLMKDNLNKGYGEWCRATILATFQAPFPLYIRVCNTDVNFGLSRIACFCDPTEANLNDYVYEPPKKKKCIEHHEFNEATQMCEWKHDPKFCGELITYDGRRQMIEIPNWPTNKKYDVDHWKVDARRVEDFQVKITEVIVRQHCWFSLFQWEISGFITMPPTGYGKHQVLSHFNGKLGSIHDGTHRVICECLH